MDGQGKLAERNETSSSALPALQHLLGGLRAEHPLVALPTFWVLFIQKFARRARAPKLLIYFGPGARDRRRTTDVGALKDAPSIMSDEFDSLDATEKAAIRATLIRCRVLAAKIANELRGPSTSLTSCRWQTFTPPLSTLPGSLNRKDDRFDNSPTPTTAVRKS